MPEEAVELVGVADGVDDPKRALSDLQAFARSRGGWGQLLDADRVVGRDHVFSALAHARRAFQEGRRAAASVEVELLLYVSGERQISKAIESAGAKPRRPFVVVLGGGLAANEVLARFSWRRDDRQLEPTARKLRALGFSEGEVRAAGNSSADLALERVARVDLLK